MEEVRAEHEATQTHEQLVSAATFSGKPQPLLGRSAEFCLSRNDLPTLDAIETTKPEHDEEERERGELVSSEASGFSRPNNGMLEDELGRTGEYYFTAVKPS